MRKRRLAAEAQRWPWLWGADLGGISKRTRITIAAMVLVPVLACTVVSVLMGLDPGVPASDQWTVSTRPSGLRVPSRIGLGVDLMWETTVASRAYPQFRQTLTAPQCVGLSMPFMGSGLHDWRTFDEFDAWESKRRAAYMAHMAGLGSPWIAEADWLDDDTSGRWYFVDGPGRSRLLEIGSSRGFAAKDLIWTAYEVGSQTHEWAPSSDAEERGELLALDSSTGKLVLLAVASGVEYEGFGRLDEVGAH
jgi:hypothetical protein